LQGDKNSIVQSAANYIHELKVARDQLQRRSEELKAKILGHDAQQPCVKVQFEVDEPSSSIDSMIGALRSLKTMNVKTRGIRSTLAGHRLTTEINVETTVSLIFST
jgi:phage shock protein A